MEDTAYQTCKRLLIEIGINPKHTDECMEDLRRMVMEQCEMKLSIETS